MTVGSAGSQSFPFLSLPLPSSLKICIQIEMFAATGWRVGWLIGPPDIIRPTLAATTRIVFCSNSPLQEAAAAGLEEAKERNYFETTVKEYEERRNVLVKAFDELGLQYSLPEGSYFCLLVRVLRPSSGIGMLKTMCRISPESRFQKTISSLRP